MLSMFEKTSMLGPFLSRFWRQNRVFLRKRGVSKGYGKMERNLGPQGSAGARGSTQEHVGNLSKGMGGP